MTFEQWLKTEHGKNCMAWPILDPKFLRNRLWWAFQGGIEAGQNERLDAKPQDRKAEHG